MINTVLQACFQVPRITLLLESSIHPQLVGLRSVHDRYKRGTGPLTIGNLASLVPPGMRPRTADAGKTLTGLCTLLGQESMIYHLAPEETLANSIRTDVNKRDLPQQTPWVNDSNTLILQDGRSDLTGSKIKQHTTYPTTLDSETYRLTSGRPLVHPVALQVVIVHQGHEVDKGHYIIFIKLTNSSGWALCDDDKVQWVSEMEDLTQEAFILIYTKPDTLGATGTDLTGARVISTTTTPNTVQPVFINADTHKYDASTVSCLGLEELFEEMTIQDTSVEKEKSRLDDLYDRRNRSSIPLLRTGRP